ncbi:hypothetical protein HPB50_026354 [Hyalomma asiaticum]|uniref:Uncharacterized protein n=1 Tax=Hyalomma asiaticum TaxID=266040 RepID=A0ACB7SYB5_HYAAI|nr:hypothetical protein HPB50_026354 [Hyalomma asiaticum]
MYHAHLFFAPQIVLILALVSTPAPSRICPTVSGCHDAVQDRRGFVNRTCGLVKLPSFLDAPLDGHLAASRTSVPAEWPPLPSPFKSSLLTNLFSGHASSTRYTMHHAHLLFAPQGVKRESDVSDRCRAGCHSGDNPLYMKRLTAVSSD